MNINYEKIYFTIPNITIEEDRKIKFNDEWYGDDFCIIDKLYDLIQAGLVEKVKE